jgi:OPT family oligopeptide transporter
VRSGGHFTVLENNTMQTSASAAAAMAGAGMTNAVPALMLLTHRQLGFFEIAAWLTSVAFIGVCFAIPLKRQMINVENLKFPTGIAAAETTLALHGEGEGGAQKPKALFGATAAGGLLCLLRGGLELIPESLPKVGPAILGHSMAKLTLQLDLSLLNMGAGALIGLRTTAWMAIGGTIAWLGIVPWAIDHHYVVVNPDAPNYFGRGVKWTMWPGVTMLVVSGLVSFALRGKSIVAALRTIGTIRRSVGKDEAEKSGTEDVEIPVNWFLWAFGAASILCLAVQYFVFAMPLWQSALAIVLSSLLALVATRAVGETDVNPIGGMGKVMQLLFAVVAPGNVQSNLMSAGITAAGANNCGDMMQDLKTGRMLGASPKKQFLAQLIGIATGSIVTVFVFVKAFPLELIGTKKYPAPAVQTWKGMAELLTDPKGVANLPPYTVHAMAVAGVLALAFTLVSELGSDRVKRLVPSATGLGLAFILPASNCYTFFLGAVVAEIVTKRRPKFAEIYVIAIASGLIAGESVMGVLVALYTAMHH